MKAMYVWPALLALAVAMPAVSSAEGDHLAKGKYLATLSPTVTEDTADKIEAELKKIEDLRGIDVDPADSSLHFTVRKSATVAVNHIQEIVDAAAPGTSVSEPTMVKASRTPGASSSGSRDY